MNELLPYILKSTLCLSLLYLAFRTVMRKETFFALNRILLLAVVTCSTLIPLINLPQIIQPVMQEKLMPAFPVIENHLPEFPVVADPPQIYGAENMKAEMPERPFPVMQLTGYIYLAGMLFSLLVLIHGLVILLLLFRKAEIQKMEGYKLLIIEKDIPAFSFWKLIFISRADYTEHGPTILAHEQQHIRLGHFYDLLLMEMAKMIHWFNPVIYWLIQDLKAIHEYQADQHTLTKGIDARKYQLLIIEKGVGHQRLALANSFNHCQIKKRITMMNKQTTGKAWRWKVAIFLPLLALLLMAFGREVENEPPKQGILSLGIISPQDSVKQWTEADFKVFTKETREEIFFEGKTLVIVQIDANSKITVDDETYTINEIPDRIQKWIDFKYAEQKEHIHFNKVSINGQTKMSPSTVITARKDTNTPQEDYLKLLNVVANTVLKVRGNYSKEIFNAPYNRLSVNQRKEIDQLIPMNVAVTNAQLKKFEIAPPPPLQSLNIEIRKDGNYINNRLYSLEEVRKKAEVFHKSNPNAVISLKVDKDVQQERVNEIREVVRNVKVIVDDPPTSTSTSTVQRTLIIECKPNGIYVNDQLSTLEELRLKAREWKNQYPTGNVGLYESKGAQIPYTKVIDVLYSEKIKSINTTIRSEDEDNLFTYNDVTQKPVFTKGDFDDWIGNEIKKIHNKYNKYNNFGFSYSFIISESGEIKNITVKGIGVDRKDINTEFETVLAQMPQWSPGQHKGKAAKVKYARVNAMQYTKDFKTDKI